MARGITPMKAQDPLASVYKTGQRVPVTGHWKDQHGIVTYHEAHATFPPCVYSKGECAYRRFVTS